MKQKELLTNETLQGVCSNNFELTQYAIELGRYYLRAGHEITIQGLLAEIKKHPDPQYLNELKNLDLEPEREEI